MNKNVYSLRTKRIGLDWIGFWFTKPDWTGSGSLANGLGPDWILSNESVSYSGQRCIYNRYSVTATSIIYNIM